MSERGGVEEARRREVEKTRGHIDVAVGAGQLYGQLDAERVAAGEVVENERDEAGVVEGEEEVLRVEVVLAAPVLHDDCVVDGEGDAVAIRDDEVVAPGCGDVNEGGVVDDEVREEEERQRAPYGVSMQ